MSSGKKLQGFRLTRTARLLLVGLAKEMGVSMTAAVEIAIREAARKRGVSR